MKLARNAFSFFVVVLAVLSAAPALAQDFAPRLEPSSEQIMSAVTEARSRWYKLSGARAIGPLSHECNTSGEPISCPTTRSASITTHDCLSEGFYIDFYRFAGTAGQTVTISVTSSNFDVAVALLTPSGGLHANDDDGGTGTNALLTSTLDSTGNWFIAITSPFTNTTGSYSLSLTCSTIQTGCTPSSTNLCLAGNRFKVETRFRTNNGQSGAGQAVSLTSDTGYFWFFSNTNVEVVLKVLDACGFPQSPRYWVFAGGLTDVEVDMTVTDTLRNVVKTYRNPIGTAFQPIQDTNAFATCP